MRFVIRQLESISIEKTVSMQESVFDGGKWLTADLPARRDYEVPYTAKAKLGQISPEILEFLRNGYFCKKW